MQRHTCCTIGIRIAHESLDRSDDRCIVTGEFRRERPELDSEPESLHCGDGREDMRSRLTFDEWFDGEFGTQHTISVRARLVSADP